MRNEPPLPIALIVIDNHMKTLIILLLASGLLKVATLSVRIISSQEDKEIRSFYENESFRKYLEHDYDYTILKMLTREQKNVPLVIKERSKGKQELTKRDGILRRTWYQEYLKLIRDSISVSDSLVIANLDKFPEVLQNTVLEENAKNEIWRISNQYGWFESEFVPSELKGMIKDIKLNQDSLSLEISPFSFDRQELFDGCFQNGQSIQVKSNPFLYTGSLHNWICTKLNPVSNKIEKYEIGYQ